jgi:hypothetical protein
MADDVTETTAQTAGEAGSSTNAAETGRETAAQNAGGQGERAFTQDDVNRIVEDRLRKEREARKRQEDEAKRLQEAEDAKKRGEWEAVANTEKARREQAEARLRDKAVKAEVAALAVDLEIVDVETALALVKDRVEFDADNEPANVGGLLKELIKNKPFLVKPKEQRKDLPPAGGRNPGAGSGKAEPTQEQRQQVAEHYASRW